MVEVLREFFGDAVTDEAAAAFLEELQKRFVPKDDYDSRQREAAVLQQQLAGDAEGLRAQLEEIKLQNAVDAALRRAGVRNETAARALLDMAQIGFADGALSGLDEQIAALQQSDGYLFAAPDKPRSYSKGAFARTPGGRPTRQELEQMTYSQLLEAKKKYPDLEI